MKEFMLIFIGTDYETEDFSPELAEQQMGKWFAWVDKLQKEDLYVEGRPLVTAAKRVGGKDRLVSDGPFVETKELVGGYFIVKARNWDHAVELTADYPDYEYGGYVEVREVAVYDQA
jgi:hypothetical protein